MDLTPNMENYLEVIFDLQSEGQASVRVRDIASRKGVKMPSVSAALKRLKEFDLIEHDRYEQIFLTEKGKIYAAKLARFHAALKRFFTEFLKVRPEIAERDACLVEHQLSTETLRAFVDFLSRVDCRSVNI